MSKIPNEIISINLEEIDFDDKEAIKNLILKLFNVIEMLAKTTEEQRQEIQRLKDEINRLKGEKGKPKISPNMPRKENDIIKTPKNSKWKKRSKKPRIKIDRVENVEIDKSILPPDAEPKGYRSVIKQNIKFETDNVEYRLERYYSPSEKKTYEAELPWDVQDSEYGSDLKAYIMYLYYVGRVTEPKIYEMLNGAGCIISRGEISNILTKEKSEEFSMEKLDIFETGMECSDYFHIDDTGGRHKGTNHHVNVLCNTLFTAFFVLPKKDRGTIKSILGLKTDEQIEKIMLSDDARQFWSIALLHALCWIHEVRHYKKMNPALDWHRIKLHEVLTEIWKFYEQLKDYKENPDERQKEFLDQRFDELFSLKTGYEELDKRIALTKEKKDRLLLVLDYPQIPLHNNPAEIALREFVLKKKISYGTRSEDGRTAWENMMSIMDTCRKYGVSFFKYLRDIFSGEYSMPRLSTLILAKAMVNSTSY